jgi:hypothetical protein
LNDEERTMTLKAMLNDASVGIDRIAAHLDALGMEERVAEVFALGRADQRRLYDRAQASAPLTLDDFVPAGIAPLVPVRHRGKNTLPLLPALKRFEKRMCRPADGSARLFGYNENPPALKALGLVGYFVGLETTHEPAGQLELPESKKWRARGGVVVDYFQVPDATVAPGWPRVIPNTRGLQYFVFNGTRDFMRRVSDGVSIGAAYKGEHKMDHYFVLVRQPVG